MNACQSVPQAGIPHVFDTLTIGPVFLGAAVYLCLARVVVLYGQHLSLMQLRSYTLLFCCCDFLLF